MAEDTANRNFTGSRPIVWRIGGWHTVYGLVLAAIVLACIAVLEWRFVGIEVEEIRVSDTPVTLYRVPGAAPAPPVIVAHGFAGSRQMMDQIAVSVARQGFLVASVDLPGHGRHRGQLSPDIARLEGTTAQLVTVVEEVADVVAARADTAGPVSYIGHSMATDIVIRAAQSREDVGGVVAISMYSPAVTQTEPRSLLVLSGAREGHLRDAGLDAVRQVDPAAQEGDTVFAGDVSRKAAVAPYVGHVGVLYAQASLEETTRWLREVVGAGRMAPLDRTGWISGVLFAGLVLLVWPLSAHVPQRAPLSLQPVPRRAFVACVLLPIPVALLIALFPVLGISGNAAFGSLAGIFAACGLLQIAVLRRAGIKIGRPDLQGTLIYLAFALTFALALDRYGAAFMPTGDRVLILFGLLIGTLPLMTADSLLVQGASLLRHLLVRLSLLTALAGAMALAPAELGLAVTTLPVLVLFFAVYGTMARWVAAQRGASGVALGKAIAMAWAVAASTPLFAITGLS